MNNKITQETLAGGCFWCTEAVFQRLKGVTKVTSGYSGGSAETANYHAVCTGKTGHAKCIQIEFDPEVIDYATILKVHLSTHNPTTRNRQGADTGPQYRSAIFYHNESQKKTAEAVIAELTETLGTEIVTTLEPFEGFYPAETEHHNFYQENPLNGYCQAVIVPKMAKFRAQWVAYLD